MLDGTSNGQNDIPSRPKYVVIVGGSLAGLFTGVALKAHGINTTILERKVILVGDALAGFRPHTVAGTSQAAFDVLMLVEWLEGRMDMREFERRTVEYARKVQDMGKFIGNRSQFEERSLKDYVEDRNMMSTRRDKLEFPD